MGEIGEGVREHMELIPPPRGPVFYGEYDLTIDDKNRLLVPSEIRKAFKPERDGIAFVVTIGINDVPWLYPANYYEELAQQAPASVTPANAQLRYDRLNFARASRIEWDKQGRLLMPDRTIKRTKTQRQVTLIGVRDHLEMWNRDAWELQCQLLEKERVEIAEEAKRARLGL
jgi:MraZ protein